MNYSQIIKATPALTDLKQLRLPYSVARDIYIAHKKLDTEFLFFVQEEKKLVDALAAKDADGNPIISPSGRVSFPDVEAKNKYEKLRAELGAQEIEIELPTITLSCDDFGEQLISPETIEALENIISFK